MTEPTANNALDPYEVASDAEHTFWADAVADVIEAQRVDADDAETGEPIVIKGGVSPSGIPHLGHFNEILRGYFVAEVLRERGHDVRQVFTSDDRDRLRAIPRQLADTDWNIVGLDEVDAGALGRNLGRPYTDVPDPFGSRDSYGDHFTALLRESVDQLGLDVEFVSNTACYEDGSFDEHIQTVLGDVETAREVLASFQDKVDDEYLPFFATCEECGLLTEDITEIDLDAETVSYRCSDVEAGDDVFSGCGHKGTISIRDGKLPWRFEWPAQWAMLGVDFEPFGKDHAEGSWPSGVEIAEEVFGIEPPVPMVYEWFTLEGEALSSSSGNVVTVDEVLQLLEPEVLYYFFAKEPLKQRDFSIERLDQLVDEFDRFEQLYFDEIDGSESETARAKRVYPLLVDEPRRERIRIPYTFAAVLGMTDDESLREEIARREGHIPDDAPEWAIDEALARVERARTWARRTENEFDYELKRTEIPAVSLDSDMEAALDDLAAFIEEGQDGDAIQEKIFSTARTYDMDVGDLFSAGYRLFFDEEQGPKLGPFLAKLDREFVVARLRRKR